MPDREIFVEPNELEVILVPFQQAQGEEEPESFAFYGEQGEVISIQLPTEEEIDELLDRLESGGIY